MSQLFSSVKRMSLSMIIVRGPSGVGKTTLAHKLKGDKGAVFSLEEFFTTSNGYQFNPKKVNDARKWNQERALKAIENKVSPIIIDDYNLQAWTVKPYVVPAIEQGYSVEVQDPDTPWKSNPYELANKNIHGTNVDGIRRMIEQFKSYTIDDILASEAPSSKPTAPVSTNNNNNSNAQKSLPDIKLEEIQPIDKLINPFNSTPENPLRLIIMRGVSGSGKSTLANFLAGKDGIVLSTDHYFMSNGTYQFDIRKLGDAHKWNQDRAIAAFNDKKSPIVIDNTALQSWEPKNYIVKGLMNGYNVEIYEPNTPWKRDPIELAKRNTHGVKSEIIQKMIEKWENYTIKQSLESISPDFKRNAPKKEVTPDMVEKLDLLRSNQVSMLTLYIMRGISGSGKSTLAAELAGKEGVVYSTDEYFMVDNKYTFDFTKLGDAHKWNQERAAKAFTEWKNPVVIDNTNLQPWECKPYVTKALEMGYKIAIMEPTTPWKKDPIELTKRNQHGVNLETVVRMLERWENYSIEDVIMSQPPVYRNAPGGNASPKRN